MRALLLCLVVCLLPSICLAELVEKEVKYKSADLEMKGFLVYDDSIKGERPGVLVVHEWWGQTDYPRKRARMLAKLGYTAFALDMYGEGKVASHPKKAGEFSKAVLSSFEITRDRFYAAYSAFKKLPQTDPDNIAAIGYCFGGSVVLEMARIGTPLKGVVSFHGGLNTKHPAQQDMVYSKVLVLHGADDEFIPENQIEAFKEEMGKASAEFKFISYPGAKHGFSNPEADKNAKEFKMPIAYNKDVDKKSWAEMEKFLKDVLS